MSTSGILAGLTALVVGVVPAGAAAQHPDLAGSWKLNQAQSDNPRDQMRAPTARAANGGRAARAAARGVAGAAGDSGAAAVGSVVGAAAATAAGGG